jgi:glycosyltransferase involved in cell wall biosynthesis
MSQLEQDSVRYSVIIPVFNSAAVVGETVDRTVAFFEGRGLGYELILVNDGSRDGSWDVLRQKAGVNRHIVAIDLLHNCGQHTATLCGLRQASGEYAITIDDDMQVAPEELGHLIDRAAEGFDLVLGRYAEKRHNFVRRCGSSLVAAINCRIFNKPKDLVTTSLRLMRRDVVDRICAYRTAYPYITGLAILFSARRANALVEHRPRPVGRSGYGVLKITELVMRILFNYSAYPLRLLSVCALGITLASFGLGVYFLGRKLLGDVQVPGWTTLVVMLSFFNGVLILFLSMLGEYMIRLLHQTSVHDGYHVREIISQDG